MIAKDREAERSKEQRVANEETQNRLDRLARKASEFLKQQLDDIEELTQGEAVDNEAFSKHGISIIPTYLNVGLGSERTLTVYVNRALANTQNAELTVEVDGSALSVYDSPVKLREHPRKEDQLFGTFRVRGEVLEKNVVITAKYGSLSQTALADVIKQAIEEHSFDQPVKFEHSEYRVREGSRRSLELFAKYPEVVDEPTMVNLTSSDSAGVPIRGTCLLTPVAGSNYAHGSVVVQGRKINVKAEIKASVNGREATTQVRVVQKTPEASIPMKVEVRDEDYGKLRTRWADHEGKPHLLLVSARHKSLSRYLGPAPDFEGQNTLHFRVILAEIIAEAVCFKSLELECKGRTWEFRFADHKEDHIIADDVRARLQQRFCDFVAVAHSIMLSDAEVPRIVHKNGSVS